MEIDKKFKGVQITEDGYVISDPIQKTMGDTHRSHHMESLFDIDPGTTEMTHPLNDRSQEVALADCELYDEKDSEIERQYQEVYDAAMDAFDSMTREAQDAEGKFQARQNEVSVMMLTTALNAAKEKSRLKEHKDKLSNKTKTPSHTVTNNTLVMSSADLIKQLAQHRSPSMNDLPVYGDSVDEAEVVEQTTRTKINRKKPSTST